MRQPRAKMIGLSRADARALIMQQPIFTDALVLANHYELNLLHEWIQYAYLIVAGLTLAQTCVSSGGCVSQHLVPG